METIGEPRSSSDLHIQNQITNINREDVIIKERYNIYTKIAILILGALIVPLFLPHYWSWAHRVLILAPILTNEDREIRKQIINARQFDYQNYLTNETSQYTQNEDYEPPRYHRIFHNVYLGNIHALGDVESLRIKRIISITKHPTSINYNCPNDIKRIEIQTDDTSEAINTIFEQLNTLFQFIEEGRAENEPILVHCTVGASRSATVLLAYLMKFCKVSYAQALNYVQNIRGVVEPIPDLQNRLQQYEKEVLS